jgi:hypothetical protein
VVPAGDDRHDRDCHRLVGNARACVPEYALPVCRHHEEPAVRPRCRNPGVPDSVWPIVQQGCTLNYEMFFYALFAFSLAALDACPRACLHSRICAKTVRSLNSATSAIRCI